MGQYHGLTAWRKVYFTGRLLYFRMLLVGFLEGIDSERGIAWRTADSITLRRFLGYGVVETAPDHSNLSRTRRRIDLETHQAVFDWVLGVLAKEGLLKGKEDQKAAVYANRRRTRGARGKVPMRKRGKLVERSFAHVYDTGGMRRTHLCGHEDILKRLLIPRRASTSVL